MAKKLNLDEVKNKFWTCGVCGENLGDHKDLDLDDNCPDCGEWDWNCHYPNVDWDFAYVVYTD